MISASSAACSAYGACDLFAKGDLRPCSIVIFGGSGDLAARKLIPALYNLFIHDALPDPINIVGASRTVMSDEVFKDRLYGFLIEQVEVDQQRWLEFSKKLFYQAITYDNGDSYLELADFLDGLDQKNNTLKNRMFYLAVPPSLYPVIGAHLGQAGLAVEGKDGEDWARIVVEKPFGRDLDSARELERILHDSFNEHQIFRIDHYLAKETVQNILMLRFANTIFEPLWNRSFIDHVGIVTTEKLGVEHRAGYYEQSGVLRDMFQNHLMQLLALTAMEPPSHFVAERVQDEKVKVFRALKPLNIDNHHDNLILGQYAAGMIDNQPVCGYRDESGVTPDSLTPTFAMLRVYIDNWRWRNVPFYLVSGKRMERKETKIVIQFKNVPHSMFRNVLDENILANRLILGVYPEEKISLSFQTKNPGAKECLRPVTMDFKYNSVISKTELGAYEMVLLDCILGDHMLFWRQDGVELSWSFITPVLQFCENCLMNKDDLQFYPAGSLGPEKSQEMINLLMKG
ncbi:MAG: glucose-6-phosphate dehydrogenase [Desulfobulbaceae bacterium]|nr:glucose-6-phosphate dehydrogenase [Desulfobulbaceae bacterium]HIJ79815.1 glucose-6-phosphate dehydrogenase [Deltaproteobacteria bacterium]